jgi:phage tail tape-measure protein
MVGVVLTVTEDVVIGKLADVAPPETMTLPADLATAGLVLLRVTAIPPLGAGAVNVTVPVELFPPETLAGDKVNDDAVGALTVRVAVFAVMYVAVIPTGVFAGTGTVEIVKVAVDALPRTVTGPETDATAG